MSAVRATKRRWLKGCVGAAGAFVVLCGLAIVGFFKFMDALNKVPPESTQIVLYNDTSERLRIDRIDYGAERILIDADPILETKEPGKFTWFAAAIWREQPEISRKISVLYTGMTTGAQWKVSGFAERIPDRPCKFVVFLRVGGGEISSCRYNELQDFEGD